MIPSPFNHGSLFDTIKTISAPCFHSLFANRDTPSHTTKPAIAAVNGPAPGGGTELAPTCDTIHAGENAVLGQPEVSIGTTPGPGGTQRWPRLTNKSIAMEVGNTIQTVQSFKIQTCPTGDRPSAQDAKEAGSASKVFPTQQLAAEAAILADRIAKNSPSIVKTAKKSVNSAHETSPNQGLEVEKHPSQSTFATNDRREGMAAPSEKRAAKWSGNRG